MARFRWLLLLGGLVFGVASVLRADANAIVELSTYPAAFVADGDAGDQLGNSVAVGDITGDDVNDIVLSGPLASPGARTHAGSVRVIEGPVSIPGSIDFSSTAAEHSILGQDPYDQLDAVAVGDLNGDNIEDIALGARSADGHGSGSCVSGTGDRCEAGETYIVYGSASLPSTIDLSSAPPDVTIYGSHAGDYSGGQLTIADFNDDSVDDLAIGAPFGRDGTACGGSDCRAGNVYVVFGGPSLPSMIDLSTTNPGMVLSGQAPLAFLGSHLAAGDVNGDGVADLVAAGGLNVVFGSSMLPSTLDFDLCGSNPGQCPDVRLSDSFFGGGWIDAFPTGLTLGDVDGDGYADIIAGAHEHVLQEGPLYGAEYADIYIIRGGSALPSTVVPTIRLKGTVGTSATYYMPLMATDLNGDSADDMLISIQRNSPDTSGLILLSGNPNIWLFDGGFYPYLNYTEVQPPYGYFPPLELQALGNVTGNSMASGDLNGDGSPDALIGVSGMSGSSPGQTLAGRLYVLPGIQPSPVDTDGDQCTDEQEGGSDEFQGGLRNYLNPYDYFNPSHDGQNRVDDILLVVHQYFIDSGSPNYNADTDRTLAGPNAWNLGAPNGQQRVDDILNIVHQYYNDCS